MIIAGPNGAGKTTFALAYTAIYGFQYLSADAIAAEFSPSDLQKVKVRAGRVFLQRLEDLLKTEDSIIIESTLAGLRLKRVIENLKLAGYEVSIVFIFLDSPDVCIARIKARVLNGGHYVPVRTLKDV